MTVSAVVEAPKEDLERYLVLGTVTLATMMFAMFDVRNPRVGSSANSARIATKVRSRRVVAAAVDTDMWTPLFSVLVPPVPGAVRPRCARRR